MKLLFTIILLFLNSIFAMDPIVLTKDTIEYPMGMYLEILEDQNRILTIDDIQKEEFENRWIKSDRQVPSFGFTKSIYWVRLKIKSDLEKKYFLEIRFPQFDKVSLFQIKTKSVSEEKQIGDYIPFKERDVPSRNLVFVINPSFQIDNLYFLRFETSDSMMLPISIWTEEAFLEKSNLEMYLFGMFFGALIVMGFYNLFVWISIRDNTYFFYVMYIFTFVYFWFNYTGLMTQYIWRWSIYFYHLFYAISIPLSFVFMISFTINFLQTEKTLPKIHRLLNVFRLIFIVTTLGTLFMDHQAVIILLVIEIVLVALLMIFGGILSFALGYRSARYYMLAWMTLLLGGIILALRNAGFLPSNPLTEYSAFLGTSLEVILLSLGLADRINDLQKQNVTAQVRALEAEKRGSKVKDEFLANLSHELRTPMTTVFVLSELLAGNDNYPDEVREFAKEIRAGSGKLNDYVNDLILVTDIETNLKLQKNKIEISKLIESVLVEVKQILEEQDVQIIFEAKEKIEFDCDSILLAKAIEAILKNAIVYNKPKGTVEITFRKRVLKTLDRTFKGIEISIKDNGIGISKEFHDKIFEKFFRVDTSLSYEVSGVGLGLFIARKIVELHGGTIRVKSELGNGSEFTIDLPEKS